MPSFLELPDRLVVANDVGSWAIFTIPKIDNGLSVGPGYIARAVLRGQKDNILVDGFISSKITGNDPRIQGLGIVGWHHYRDIPDVTDIWDKGWDFDGHKIAHAPYPLGVSESRIVVKPTETSGTLIFSMEVDFVDSYSSIENKRVARIRYDYKFFPKTISCWVTWTLFPDGFDSGPTPFIKEPKLIFGMCPQHNWGIKLSDFELHSHVGHLIETMSLNKVGNPRTHTLQMGNLNRAYADFFTLSKKLHLRIALASSTALVYGVNGNILNYGKRSLWTTGGGLDTWAFRSNSRKSLDPNNCNKYCLQGPNNTLTRNWELAKDPRAPGVQLMAHAWEGGTGLPDCLCAARAFEPQESYTNYFSISFPKD